MEKDSFADWLAGWFGSEHPVRCFIARFWGAIAVATLLIGFVVGVFTILDKADIVKRALDTFSHYSSSLPWLLILVSLVLVLCIPGGPTALTSLLRRVKKISPVELYPADDPDEKDLMPQVTQNKERLLGPKKESKDFLERARMALQSSTPEQRADIKKRLLELKQQKKQILWLHAGQTGSVIVRRGVRTKTGNLFFDADCRHGENQILVRLASASSKDSRRMVQMAKDIVDVNVLTPPMSHDLSIHLVFYSSPTEPKFNANDIETIRKTLFNVCYIRLYFYSITSDFAVKPLEDIP